MYCPFMALQGARLGKCQAAFVAMVRSNIDMPQVVYNQAGALGEDAVAVSTVLATECGLETTA